MNLKRYIAILFLLPVWLMLSAGLQQPKPHVFLLGDSISIHYGPYLKKEAADFAEVELKKIETANGKEFPRNGGDSRRVLDYITHKLKDGFKPDYLLFNCGLHDINRDTASNELQVPLDEYIKNLEKTIELVKQKGIKMIWITTTPVVDSIHNSRTKAKFRFAADLLAYNKKAGELCRKNNIPVIDLNEFTRKLGNNAYIDNVHYKEYAREQQATYLAEALKEILKEKKQVQ